MPSRKTLVVIGVAVALVVLASVLYYTVLLPGKGEWELTVIVNGKAVKTYKLHELEEMACTLNITRYGTVKAVPLAKLLEDSGCDLNRVLVYSITAVGADGYTRTIKPGEYGVVRSTYLYLPDAYVYLVEERYVAKSGPLRLVVEGLGEKYWVKYLVKLEVETCPWRLDIMVNGKLVKSYTLDELEKMKETISCGGSQLSAVPLPELVKSAGVDLGSVKGFEVYASDGYCKSVSGSYLSKAYIQLVSPDYVEKKGPLRIVIVGLSKKYWVHRLVAVNLVAPSG